MHRCIRGGLLATAILCCGAGLANAQVTITELGAANAARNQMMGDSAQAAAGAQPADAAPSADAPAAGSTPSVTFGGMKYTLSYALMLMLIGVGMFLVCRPSNRHDPE